MRKKAETGAIFYVLMIVLITALGSILVVLSLKTVSARLENRYVETERVPFDNILGCSGYYVDERSRGFFRVRSDWRRRTYYAYSGYGAVPILQSCGRNGDMQMDLDGDGNPELITECWSHNGKQQWVFIYTVRNGIIYRGCPDPVRWKEEGHDCILAENLLVFYNPLLWTVSFLNPDTGEGYATDDMNILTFEEWCEQPVCEEGLHPIPRNIF